MGVWYEVYVVLPDSGTRMIDSYKTHKAAKKGAIDYIMNATEAGEDIPPVGVEQWTVDEEGTPWPAYELE